MSTVKKSHATAAWERRNSVQVTSDRFGAGSMPLSLRICHTVEDAILCPRPTSSPCMRRWPHVGFSFARRTINCRSSAVVGGLPGRLRGGRVQCLAMRFRCQRSNVSGVTIQPCRSRLVRAAAMAPSRTRSLSLTAGRSTRRRNTWSWWRNTMISRSFECPERTASRARPAKNW